MVDLEYVEKQLRNINFGNGRVNRAELKELQNILLEDEIIYECVNGFYEGGVALLVATDIRVLLIDKKPMGFLNVDDLRFDNISDIDYSHRAFGAKINVNCGMKSLQFKSYNQRRLRKLIGHVQHRMSEIKREQSQHATMQKQHLEEINKQLQMYLMAQHQQLQRQLDDSQKEKNILKPNPQLADYLFAQRLMDEFYNKSHQVEASNNLNNIPMTKKADHETEVRYENPDQKIMEEMVEAGRMEVFGGGDKISHNNITDDKKENKDVFAEGYQGVDVTPFRIAYAKLPYFLKNRRFRNSYSSNFYQR